MLPLIVLPLKTPATLAECQQPRQTSKLDTLSSNSLMKSSSGGLKFGIATTTVLTCLSLAVHISPTHLTHSPDPPILAFFDFLAFFVFRFSLLFFVRVFPSFSMDCRGSAKRKTLAFFSGKTLAFSKKARVGGSGSCTNIREPGDHPGKRKAYTALLQCRTFLCRKKWGRRGEHFWW